MKKPFILLFFIIITFQIACKSDDDSVEKAENILAGTTWESEKAEDGIYTFTSNTEYTFKDPGEPFFDGTYTFDGRNGTLKETETDYTAEFEVAGDVMIITDFNPTPNTYYKK